MGLQSDALTYFREVVEAGSIHAAARNVVIAPSALSRQMKLLEREVGAPLFRRTPQGMVPTDAGAELYDFARRRMAETEDILKRIRSGFTNEPAEFRIACVEGVMARLLPRWLASLRQRHPRVRFYVAMMASADVTAAVASGDADVGFSFGRVARADLRELATLQTPIRLAVPREHRLVGETAASLDRLVTEWCVIPDHHFGIRREIDRECARAGITLKVAYETNSLAFGHQLVQTEGLVAFTAAIMATGFSEDPVFLPLTEDGFNSSAIALVSHATTASALVGTLRHQLAQLMRAEGPMLREQAVQGE